MSRVFVRGIGVVSPAGWGVAPLVAALRTTEPLPTGTLPGPSPDRAYPVRLVPPHTTRPEWLTHPRLRRASAISHFAMAAAWEALSGWRTGPADAARLGIVTGTHAASIRYSGRFFGEVLQDPAIASPMLFPETVINAPASHLAAVLGATGLAYSVIGDQTAFVQALRVACHWLETDRVDAALVLGLDEAAWPVADALRCFSRHLELAEGAGALLLSREPGPGPAVLLERLTESHLYAGAATRQTAVHAMRRELPAGNPGDLLVDAACGVARIDGPEALAWAGWPGARLSPRRILGEGLCAATGWQFVAAAAMLHSGQTRAANVSVVGSNQEAVGARLIRSES